MTRATLGATWLLLLAGGAHAQAPAFSGPVPMERIGSQYCVTVQVNHQTPLRLQIDTGSPLTTLRPEIARDLNLDLHQVDTDKGTPVFASHLASLEVGKALVTDEKILVRSLPTDLVSDFAHPAQRIDGLLGIATLKHWALGIDMIRSVLVLWEGGNLSEEQSLTFLAGDLSGGASARGNTVTGAAKVPMWQQPFSDVAAKELVRGNFLYTVPARLDGASGSVVAWMCLDTGTPWLLIPDRWMRQVGAVTTSRQATASSVNGDLPIMESQIKRLEVGGFDCAYPTADTGAVRGVRELGAIVGIEPFQQCRIILDFPGKTFRIYKAGAAADDYRRFFAFYGIGFQTEGRDLVVHIDRGAPGEKTSLRTGDTLAGARLAAGIKGGREMVLSVRRKGSLSQVEVRLPEPPERGPLLPVAAQDETGVIRYVFPMAGTYYTAEDAAGVAVPRGSEVVVSPNGDVDVRSASGPP